MIKFQQSLKALILCLIALFCAALASQEKRRVAVLEPFGKAPVTQADKSNARGVLSEAVASTGLYAEADWAGVDDVWKKSGLQRLDINNSAKAKQLGHQLEASLICVTDIYAARGGVIVNCSMIDAATGEVVSKASDKLNNDSEAAFKNALETLAIKALKPGGRGIRPTRAAEQGAESRHGAHSDAHRDAHSESRQDAKKEAHHEVEEKEEGGFAFGITIGHSLPVNKKHGEDGEGVTSLGIFVEHSWRKNFMSVGLSVAEPKKAEGYNIKGYGLGIEWGFGFISSEQGPFISFGAEYGIEKATSAHHGGHSSSEVALCIGIGYKFDKHFFIQAGYGVPVRTSEEIAVKDLPHALRFSIGFRF
jgi:hypothetical protein